MAKQTSEASRSVEVEGHVKRATERKVPFSQSLAQVAGSVGRPSGPSLEIEGVGRFKVATQRELSEDWLDEGLAVVIKTVERGIEEERREEAIIAPE